MEHTFSLPRPSILKSAAAICICAIVSSPAYAGRPQLATADEISQALTTSEAILPVHAAALEALVEPKTRLIEGGENDPVSKALRAIVKGQPGDLPFSQFIERVRISKKYVGGCADPGDKNAIKEASAYPPFIPCVSVAELTKRVRKGDEYHEVLTAVMQQIAKLRGVQDKEQLDTFAAYIFQTVRLKDSTRRELTDFQSRLQALVSDSRKALGELASSIKSSASENEICRNIDRTTQVFTRAKDLITTTLSLPPYGFSLLRASGVVGLRDLHFRAPWLKNACLDEGDPTKVTWRQYLRASRRVDVSGWAVETMSTADWRGFMAKELVEGDRLYKSTSLPTFPYLKKGNWVPVGEELKKLAQDLNDIDANLIKSKL